MHKPLFGLLSVLMFGGLAIPLACENQLTTSAEVKDVSAPRSDTGRGVEFTFCLGTPDEVASFGALRIFRYHGIKAHEPFRSCSSALDLRAISARANGLGGADVLIFPAQSF